MDTQQVNLADGSADVVSLNTSPATDAVFSLTEMVSALTRALEVRTEALLKIAVLDPRDAAEHASLIATEALGVDYVVKEEW